MKKDGISAMLELNVGRCLVYTHTHTLSLSLSLFLTLTLLKKRLYCFLKGCVNSCTILRWADGDCPIVSCPKMQANATLHSGSFTRPSARCHAPTPSLVMKPAYSVAHR